MGSIIGAGLAVGAAFALNPGIAATALVNYAITGGIGGGMIGFIKGL